MWSTPAGDRILRSAERELFVSAANKMYEELRFADMDTNYVIGEQAFDSQCIRSRIYALFHVASLLLTKKQKLTLPTAWQDAAVYAIYEFVKLQLLEEMETDNVQPPIWRILVASAAQESGIECLPSMGSGVEEWIGLVDKYRQTFIQGCADWRLADEIMDLPPDESGPMKFLLGLPDDYYHDLLPLISKPAFVRAIDYLESLWSDADSIYHKYTTTAA